MAVKKQPNSDPKSTSAAAFDWFQQFQKHFDLNLSAAIPSESDLPDISECPKVAAQAFWNTLADSGLGDNAIFALLGQVATQRDVLKPVGVWTAELNQRRCALIDRDIQGMLSIAEQFELAELTRRMRDHVDSERNLPLEGARKLHRSLLDAKSREIES